MNASSKVRRQPAPIPFPERETLPEQKDHFTAEGSPPPGQVGDGAAPANSPGKEGPKHPPRGQKA
jgi:hypothetical protein